MRPAVHVFQIYRTAGEGLVWWRCISANGRCVARCVEPLTSLAQARDSIDHVLAAVDPEILVRPSSGNRWRWLLVGAEGTLARGSGDHDRRVRCEHAAEKFVDSIRDAVIDSTVHVFRRRDLAGRSPEAVG